MEHERAGFGLVHAGGIALMRVRLRVGLWGRCMSSAAADRRVSLVPRPRRRSSLHGDRLQRESRRDMRDGEPSHPATCNDKAIRKPHAFISSYLALSPMMRARSHLRVAGAGRHLQAQPCQQEIQLRLCSCGTWGIFASPFGSGAGGCRRIVHRRRDRSGRCGPHPEGDGVG